jgi:hypothetical protein
LLELGIEVHLAGHQFYKMEVGIEDVYARLAEIRKEFGLAAPEPQQVKSSGFCGVLKAELSGKDAEAYIILIKRNLNPETRVYTLGHEQGHFLWYLGRQDLIYSYFKRPEAIRNSTIRNSEFAILCGWIAVKNAGYTLSESVIKLSPDQKARERNHRIKEIVDTYYKK